jgi:hypothetical protein
MTRAPAAWKSSALARPMPVVPPVIKAILPSRARVGCTEELGLLIFIVVPRI